MWTCHIRNVWSIVFGKLFFKAVHINDFGWKADYLHNISCDNKWNGLCLTKHLVHQSRQTWVLCSNLLEFVSMSTINLYYVVAIIDNLSLNPHRIRHVAIIWLTKYMETRYMLLKCTFASNSVRNPQFVSLQEIKVNYIFVRIIIFKTHWVS